MFRKKTQSSQLNAFSFLNDGISFVSVNRDSEQPKIDAWDFIKCEAKDRLQHLKTLAKQHIKKNSNCTIVLQPENYRLLIAEEPVVPREELIDAIQWNVKDLLDFPIDQATLDVFNIPAMPTPQNKINVVACKKTLIESYADLFNQGKLDLTIIDIEELAIRNLVYQFDIEKQGLITLLIKEDSGHIIFSHFGELYFFRRFDVGSVALKNDDSKKETIALEVQRSIDYFDRSFRHLRINQLFIAPFDGDYASMVNFLDSNLSVKSVSVNLFDHIHCEPAMPNEILVQSLVTIGAALRVDEAA